MAAVGNSTSDALAFAGAATLAALVAAGDVSARELAELSLRRIHATQPTLNAFRCVRDEAALREADEIDRLRARGAGGPLLGVPVAIKDDMDLAGETTAFGCAGPFAPRPADGEVARRLRAAGAVIVGKTTTPELGQWPFTEGPAFGATRNPWATAHTPGGSSGGSAAAVAAGLVAVAAGSDGAGSVRIPAAWTHLVGIKPQRGRISTWPDPDPFNGLTCIGPLARTTRDAALLLDVLSGSHADDRHRPAPPAEPYLRAVTREPARLRIALSLRVPFSAAPATLDAAVRARVMWIAGVLADLGHDVEVADPAYGLIGASFIPRAMGGLGDWAEGRVTAPEQLDARTQKAIAVGRRLRPLLGTARGLERIFRRRIGRTFRDFDVVLTPTTAQPPPRIGAIDGLGGWATDKVMVAACPYAWPWNVLGWPGVNVPAGLTDTGLPVGAQLLGPAGSEGLLLALAAQLETVEGWAELQPPVGASESALRVVA
ncbi:amidase [Conexibacter sp. JD483]|uniref:amidase n=1 Tax=unclassified Conexibacter TaxID=2627773 RepID=UPI00271FB5C4|nr:MULTISPECIES: amidase [unclassified Conexibacter]MDO8186357.1 amidase [Conexibacter sp. CPCC 205706]MDO8199756.1 amidase [Conexibacter sp. CPCC 205762]MDR9372964.1 amidase [Conexibacter sp. JD483]